MPLSKNGSSSGFSFNKSGGSTGGSTGFSMNKPGGATTTSGGGGFSMNKTVGSGAATTSGGGGTGFALTKTGGNTATSGTGGFSMNKTGATTTSGTGGFSMNKTGGAASSGGGGFSMNKTGATTTSGTGGFSMNKTGGAASSGGGGFSMNKTGGATTSGGGGFSMNKTAATSSAVTNPPTFSKSATTGTGTSGFSMTGGSKTAAQGGTSTNTSSGFSLQKPGGTSSTGGFSLQKPGATGISGGATLTQKCGLSDIDEIRLAYAPLLCTVDNNPPYPTVEYIGPGGQKQPNKSCELYCWVYSPINPNMRNAYDMHDIQRREADKRNPDPTNLESEKIIGTANLKSRFDKQLLDSTQVKKELDMVNSALLVVERSARKNHDRVKELESDQTRLYHKYLTVLRKVELLRCHGSPITINEQRYREQLDKIVRAMQTPNLKIQELLIIQSQIDRSFQDVYGEDPKPHEVEKLCNTLEKQREGLQYLTDILTKDARDMDIIRKKVSQASQEWQSSRY